MSRSVFVSYARTASSRAAQALGRSLGADAFLDTADIEAGERIDAGVVDALLEARVTVHFVEPTYFTRWYCLREVSLALAPFNALVERGAAGRERIGALDGMVVAVAPGCDAVLDRLPPLLRATKWPASDDTAGLVALVSERLGTVTDTLAERLEALGKLESVRATLLEEAALPAPRSLGGIPRFALPGELRGSIGDAFVGRADELWRIHHELSTMRGDASSAALTGALEGGGGYGKTRMATEYLHRFGPSSYPGGLFWTNAELTDRLEEQLHGILATLKPGIPNLVAMREAGREVGGELAAALQARSGPPVLYVVDNIPEPPAGEPPKPLTTWCPAAGDVALLVTSRAHQSVTAGIRTFRVDSLAPAAAVAMLTRDYPTQGQVATDGWERVAEWVGHLPLALELLNASLREGVLEAGELVAMVDDDSPVRALDTSAEALAGVVPAGRLRGISEALAVSYAALPPPAQTAARLFAQLAPAPVPVAVLDALGPPANDKAVRATLVSRSFVSRPAEGSAVAVFGTMHRVLAGYLRAQAADGGTELAAACEALLLVLTPTACRDPGSWPLLNACLPHAESLFSRARAAAPGPASVPGVFLGTVLGLLLSAQGLTDRALAAADSGFALATAVLGPEHRDTLSSANNLAEALRAMGDAAGARDLHEKVQGARARLLGPEHPDTLASSNGLAATLVALGDAAGARGLLESVLAASRRLLGPEHPDTLNSANNLAETLRVMGDVATARDLHEEVYDASRRVLGPEHPDTLISAGNLAETMSALGDLAGARDLQELVLLSRRRHLGPDHPDTLTSANNLAAILSTLGTATRARHLLTQVLEARLRALGREHPTTTITAWNLYSAARMEEDFVDAAEILEQSLAWLLTAEPDRLDPDQLSIRDMLAEAPTAPDDPSG